MTRRAGRRTKAGGSRCSPVEGFSVLGECEETQDEEAEDEEEQEEEEEDQSPISPLRTSNAPRQRKGPPRSPQDGSRGSQMRPKRAPSPRIFEEGLEAHPTE